MDSEKEFFLKTSPTRLFFRAAVPGAIGMIASNIYFSVEMLMVGRFIGQTAFAGGNLAMPLLLIAYAVADMVAVGSSIGIALRLGEGRKEEADRIFTAAVISASLLSTIAAVALTAAGPMLFRLMGADDALIREAMAYLGVYTVFIPLTCLVFVFDNYLRICGRVRFSMVMNIVMALLCLVLEFIFLCIFDLGIGFAALGTSLGMSITCIICMMPFIRGRMALRFTRLRGVRDTLREIFVQGLPSFLNNTSGRITSIFMNSLLLHLGGDVAVSIYGVFMNIDGIIVPGMYGVFDSLQPAIGYNWGAKRRDRAGKIAFRCVIALAVMCAAFTFVLEVFPGWIFSLFLEADGAVVTLAVHAAVVKVGVMHREVAVVGMVLHVLPWHVIVVAHDEHVVQCGIFGVRLLYLGLHIVAVPAAFQYLVHAETEQFLPRGEPVNRLGVFVNRDYEVCARHCPRPGLGNEAHFVRYLAVCPRLVRGRVILHGIHNDVAYLPPPINGPTPRRYGNFAGIETALRGILAAFFYHTLCRSAFFGNTPRRSEAAIIVNERRIHGFHHRCAAFGHGECVYAERSGVTAWRVTQPEAFNPPHAAPVPGIAGRRYVACEHVSHGYVVVRTLHRALWRVHASFVRHFSPGIRFCTCGHDQRSHQ